MDKINLKWEVNMYNVSHRNLVPAAVELNTLVYKPKLELLQLNYQNQGKNFSSSSRSEITVPLVYKPKLKLCSEIRI